MKFEYLTYEIKENIAYIGFGKNEKKSLTTLSAKSLLELDHMLDQVQGDSSVKGLVFFSHKEDCFLAGMDVKVIADLDNVATASEGAAKGQEVFTKIEDLKIPSIALVDGFCLGGGLELSLACNKIIASTSSSTRLGLPEVMLGVLPGFGGTYRLPRKVGMVNALDMILTGKQVRAKKALKLGLVDAIMPKERMLSQASKILFKKKKTKSLMDQMKSALSDNFVANKVIFQKANQSVMNKTKGHYPAPLRILNLLESHSSLDRSKYLSEEARAFGELSQTKQSKNLLNVFFLQDEAKKVKGKNLETVSQAAVLGAGTMGGGIAWYFSKNGIASYMKDISVDALNLGLKQASANFSSALKKRRMTETEFKRKMALITPTLSYDGFNNLDLVVEAIVENMDVKKKVLSELESKVNKKTIITSNTSSLSLNEMSKALKDSSRFAGLHFFNPVNKMPLVEIIKHKNVSQETLDTLYKFVLDSKKTPVIVDDGPGFLVNRILATYLNEAAFLLEEGHSVEDIDNLALEFGLPMGPCHLMDEVGLDISEKVSKVLYAGLGERFKPSKISSLAIEKGLLGKKNQKGFYQYDAKGKKGEVNPSVSEFLKQDKAISNKEEIKLRLILPMINEAAYCIEEKIVDSPESLDLAMIFGIGFPPFRGGVLKYADQYGLKDIVERIELLAKDVSASRFSLCPMLKKKGDKKEKFYS